MNHDRGATSAIIDTTPSTSNDFSDAPLAQGKEFVAGPGAVLIRHEGFDAAGNAKLAITTPSSATPIAPSFTRLSENKVNTSTATFAPTISTAGISRFELGRSTS